MNKSGVGENVCACELVIRWKFMHVLWPTNLIFLHTCFSLLILLRLTGPFTGFGLPQPKGILCVCWSGKCTMRHVGRWCWALFILKASSRLLLFDFFLFWSVHGSLHSSKYLALCPVGQHVNPSLSALNYERKKRLFSEERSPLAVPEIILILPWL